MTKVELTPMKLACLKDAAECINPAHRSWFLNDYRRWVETYENGDAIIVCHPEQIQQALSFIAEADPATVLAMVEEIEVLKTALNLLLWEYYSTDLEQEDIDKLFKKQIEMAKKYRESESGQ